MKQFKYTINGNLYNVTVNRVEDDIAEVEVNGTPYKVVMDKQAKKTSTGAPVVARPSSSGGKGAIKSPLPGVILSIDCKAGDTVKKGQKLLVLEAMKMENTIQADRDGEVAEIKVNKGDSVLEGTDLIILK